MDKYFLILLYFSLQHSKILAAKTSLLTWLAIPRLFLFFLLVLVFSSLQTDKSTSCVARMFVLKCGHLKYFLMCDFLKYISLCCLPGPMPKYSSNGCSRKTKDRDPEHHFLWNPQALTFSLAAHPWQQTLPVLLQSLWAVRSDQNPLPTTPPHVIVQWSNLSESGFAQHFFFFITRSSHTAEDQMHSVYLVFSTNSTASLPDWEHQALSHTSNRVPEDTACILF